ncbi:Uncharacterized conserved protein [Litoreibacter janthinus]|uniref:Uncharacterized conserved protein n=1 Tax=Litoreibacter janthinus TaxID=670154 RepID=A0A1I6H0H7_9RHOB|nr:Uncharacterized conserved protein [Litoreibacter janthinus]
MCLDALFDIWRALEIRVLCDGHGQVARYTEIPQKIRGAMGHALRAGASDQAVAGQQCPFQPPCTYDLFHNARASVTGGLEMPKPFVIQTDPAGEDLLVTLRLFGEACDRAHEFGAGLVAGLRAGLEAGGGRRLRPRVLAMEQVALPVPVRRPMNTPVVLNFLTPVMQSRAKKPIFDPVSLLTGLGNRITGMARWHGVVLELDAAELKADAARIGGLAQHEGQDDHWHRGGRFSAAKVPRKQTGRCGWLRYPAPGDLIGRLLQLGVQTHIGAKCAAGPGRYMLGLEADPG